MDTGWTQERDRGTDVMERSLASAASIARVAVLADADPVEGVWVRRADDPAGARVLARSTVALSPADAGRRVVVVEEDGDPGRPIIIGVLQDAPVAAPPAAPPAPAPAEPAAPAEVEIDGRSLRLEGEQEVVLRCGGASIRLSADGRIVIKGSEIVSRARGTHKVKGATVLIN